MLWLCKRRICSYSAENNKFLNETNRKLNRGQILKGNFYLDFEINFSSVRKINHCFCNACSIVKIIKKNRIFFKSLFPQIRWVKLIKV